MQKYLQKSRFYLLLILLVFLPLSSWLVSRGDNSAISLGRDIIVLLYGLSLLFSLTKIKRSYPTILLLVSLFVLEALASYFFREASVSQWLRGLRFTIMPYLLLGFVAVAGGFVEKEKRAIFSVVLAMAAVLGAVATIEIFASDIFAKILGNGASSLDQAHYVAGTSLMRVQSLLAGPNAFGLYLLAIISMVIGLRDRLILNQWLRLGAVILGSALLVLTYSRSAFVGLAIVLFASLFLYLKDRFSIKTAFCGLLLALLIVGSIGTSVASQPKWQSLITHGDSSDLRLVQYKRIWNTRAEIGLLGRGVGTAGPSSQYRLDGGENHWTENIYLDTFEELGLIGLILYLSVLGSLIWFSAKQASTPLGRAALLLNLGFAVSGLFINIYTGQVGIYLLFLINGLLLNQAKQKEALNG